MLKYLGDITIICVCVLHRTITKEKKKICGFIAFILDILDTSLILFPCPSLCQHQNHHFFSLTKCVEYFKLLTLYFVKHKVDSCA